MNKKERLINTIKKQTFLPLYIRNAKIDILRDDVAEFINIASNEEAYQTKKHQHTSLYKPIISLHEKV